MTGFTTPLKTPPQTPRQLGAPATGDLSLRTKLLAVVAVAVLVLAVGAFGTLSVRRYHSAGLEVRRTRDFQQTLAHVMQRLTDAETGQRGYLLTGAEDFLQPYQGATADVRTSVERLKVLVAGNSSQEHRLEMLSGIITERVDSLQSRVVRRAFGVMPTLDQLRSGKAVMDHAREVIAAMDTSATAALQEQTAAADREGNLAVIVIIAGSVIAFGLLLLISEAIKRDVAQREAARERIEEQNIELEIQAHTLNDQQIELEHQLEASQVMSEELALANDEYRELTAVAEGARRSAEESLELSRASDRRYQFLADTIPVQVWTATPQGELDFVSKGVADYFGKSREETLGSGWLAVLHPDDIDPVVERWTHSLQSGEPYEVNFRLRRGSDNSYRWHLGRALALRDDHGKINGWFGSNTDIDDQYRDREERGRLLVALERTNRDLDQFAYVASHDLKAPLRGIANLSQWIEEDSGEAFPAESRHKMELLRGRVRRLEGLIDGILEYSRAGRTQAAVSLVNIGALLKDAIDLLAPPDSVTITIAPDLPSVVAESIPLTQVFSNIIGNAIKYGGKPNTVISITSRDAGAFIQFSVSDNGPGIAVQYHERIFVVFQTLAPRDKIEGTGIGLAVVKKVVEARGGRVWVESPTDIIAGTGSTFHFTWPRVPGMEQ